MRACIMCGAEVSGFATKLCSEECRRARRTERNRGYTKSRLEYYRAYNAANREHRRAISRARYHKYKQDPIRAEKIREQARRSRAKHALAHKVKRDWRVPISEARRMIERGSFPA